MSKVFLFPISVFLIFQITFICTYIAAILEGHIVPDVPYISDVIQILFITKSLHKFHALMQNLNQIFFKAATYSPESCVFGQLINIGCVLLGIVVYIRYRQIEKLIHHHPLLMESSARLNLIGMWLGIGSCVGCSIVANFQETNVRIMHYVGALNCFGLGTAYFWMQAYLSYNISPFIGSVRMAHARLGLAVLCTIFFTVVAVTGVISHILFQGKDPRKWYPSDGGWRYHVASTISEWIVATIFCFYILSFTDEFKLITFDHPTISIIGYEHIEVQSSATLGENAQNC